MQLNKIDDPRDALSKARRDELRRYGKSNGIEFPVDMPAILMRDMLRNRGLTRINIPPRPLGAQNEGAPSAGIEQPKNGIEADALADLARQWQQGQPVQTAAEPVRSTGINELRAECKRLGIKLSRRDNMDSMRAKIEAGRNGENAA